MLSPDDLGQQRFCPPRVPIPCSLGVSQFWGMFEPWQSKGTLMAMSGPTAGRPMTSTSLRLGVGGCRDVAHEVVASGPRGSHEVADDHGMCGLVCAFAVAHKDARFALAVDHRDVGVIV